MAAKLFEQGRALRFVTRLRLPGWSVALFVLTVYWLVPLVLVSLSHLANPGSVQGAALNYLGDVTHFVYSVLISIGAWSVYGIVKKVNPVIRHTLRCIRNDKGKLDWAAKYDRYQEIASSYFVMTVCAGLSIATVILLLTRVVSSDYAAWWGNIENGVTGIYFALIASQMVFWGTWSFFAISAVSIVIAHISSCRIFYEPLSADGCNGLRPLGSVIMLMWVYSLATAASIFVVFSRGYLDIEENPTVWFIALSASICFPLIAVLPLFAVVRAIRQARERLLMDVSRAYTGKAAWRSKRDADNLSRLLALSDTIRRGNIFPFRGQAVLVLAVVNVAQLSASIGELMR